MIEPLADMPPGTLGFRASGHVTGEEYKDVFLPPLRETVDAGEGIRLLYQVGPGFDRFELGALAEDTKTGWQLGLRHPDAWKRLALVTDVDWIAHATHAFAWMMPGELRVFRLAEVNEARDWVAG